MPTKAQLQEQLDEAHAELAELAKAGKEKKGGPLCIPATLDALDAELISRKTDTGTARHRLQRLRDEVMANTILSK